MGLTPCHAHADYLDSCQDCVSSDPTPQLPAEHLVDELRSLGYRCNVGKRYYGKTVTVRGAVSDKEFYHIRWLAGQRLKGCTVERPSTAYVVIRW